MNRHEKGAEGPRSDPEGRNGSLDVSGISEPGERRTAGRRIAILEVPKSDDLPWLNSNDRLNRFTEAKLKRRWRNLGRIAVANAYPHGFVPFTGRVLVVAHIWKSIANRYDPNNIWATTKPIMDGIVDAGLLADDDWKHVRGPHHEHGGKGLPKIVLRIEEEA